MNSRVCFIFVYFNDHEGKDHLFSVRSRIVITMPSFFLSKWVKSLSRVRLFVTPWTVAHQAPPSMVFSRQEYWSGLPLPSPVDLPTQESNTGLLHCREILYRLSYKGHCTLDLKTFRSSDCRFSSYSLSYGFPWTLLLILLLVLGFSFSATFSNAFSLLLSTQSAVTECHRPGGLKHRNL